MPWRWKTREAPAWEEAHLARVSLELRAVKGVMTGSLGFEVGECSSPSRDCANPAGAILRAIVVKRMRLRCNDMTTEFTK